MCLKTPHFGPLRRPCGAGRVNERTVKDHTPLPHQDEILKLLVRAVVCGKIDLVNAYYQILMHPNDINKTAFKTPFDLYECFVLPQ